MRRIPTLTTQRLIVRSFTIDDFEPYELITRRCFGVADDAPSDAARDVSLRMHTWRVLNDEMLARLDQAPYGDRAVIRIDTGEPIGSVGLVPYIDTFNVMPGLRFIPGDDGRTPRATAEVGLFWAIDPAHQGKGYATEAARAMIDYLFGEVRLARVIATTDFNNLASQAVMRKLGMRLERNATGQPPWLQVVGVLDNPT
jgi:RimJ/RimL family protein N-acetyltransferase